MRLRGFESLCETPWFRLLGWRNSFLTFSHFLCVMFTGPSHTYRFFDFNFFGVIQHSDSVSDWLSVTFRRAGGYEHSTDADRDVSLWLWRRALFRFSFSFGHGVALSFSAEHLFSFGLAASLAVARIVYVQAFWPPSEASPICYWFLRGRKPCRSIGLRLLGSP